MNAIQTASVNHRLTQSTTSALARGTQAQREEKKDVAAAIQSPNIARQAVEKVTDETFQVYQKATNTTVALKEVSVNTPRISIRL